MKTQWYGVMPAITTAFNKDLSVDYNFIAEHCRWLVKNGSTGIVTPGSLGEASTLTYEEKTKILDTVLHAVGDKVPVIAAVSAARTEDACAFAKNAEIQGCHGLMILPPYIYKGDWCEMKAFMSSILNSTKLSCMLYNNPIAYGTDFLPEHVQELSHEHENLNAVKESSTDVRRITAIRSLLGDTLAIFVGVDDAIVEGIKVGATGWIAGVVNALPKESVALFNYAMSNDNHKTFELYNWMLPLLRMDTVPKFVQLIKLIQQQVDVGNSYVRPPRLELSGSELASTMAVIRKILENRPTI